MSINRVVRLAQLPEVRLAYFEAALDGAPGGRWVGPLWEEFNAWRLRTRPALGRIDIAALGWEIPAEEDGSTFRAGVPVRSDYKPMDPAKTIFFPGGAFAYCYSDNIEEIGEAFEAVRRCVREEGLSAQPGGIEAYKFHYNLEQHPCDCGLLVTLADGSSPLGEAPSGPLPIGR
jgi:hypothetical protein